MSHVPHPRPCGDFRTTYSDDTSLFRTKVEGYTIYVGIAALLFAPLVLNDFYVSQMILIGIYAIAALGLNVLVGFTGQISLGHSAFFGFGAFASAWLNNTTGIPVFICIPLAGLMTTAIGMIFGIPAARLKGLYLAIATLASQFILQDFFARADWFSGGAYGSSAEVVNFLGIDLDTDQKYFYLVLFWVVVSFLAVSNLRRSRDGRALVAVRDHYLSAEIMGINLTRYRIMSFGVSSFFAGLGGALYAHYLQYVSVEGFTILLSIQFLAMIIIGGLGSVSGSLLGAIFILLLPQFMEEVASSAAVVFEGIEQSKAYIKEMSVGAVIILFLIFEPEGLIHRWRLIRASWKLYPFSH
ncbi:ABC transporter permease [Kiloniella litopenaei]|uniref:ABC transporter permease n=1 Tax=Kiloniella litopenaei TaxID=1549748 RepID=A0A0M2RCS7_9PROT|nr:branched-chain amino acid ABC transporter permease [Kiloniella litopenaei]KKJ77373.1 ABC transporter permease [Kiloniella litopenaei]